ncbi:UNVERIFIED_CONTAM: putative clathrin assembly protein [Sesamum latifolium]|uniref:Clathrin assembly protein n=1 Tax=Sesamum latifolium TaxID=2727402 RepID=A0AAW2SPB6_9LAMI
MGGGLDPLLLNGMYDQGMVRQHVSTAQLSGGSASSVALPGPGASKLLCWHYLHPMEQSRQLGKIHLPRL